MRAVPFPFSFRPEAEKDAGGKSDKVVIRGPFANDEGNDCGLVCPATFAGGEETGGGSGTAEGSAADEIGIDETATGAPGALAIATGVGELGCKTPAFGAVPAFGSSTTTYVLSLLVVCDCEVVS